MTAVQYSTVQYSTVQCSTPLYSTEQCSTVQCSTLTYSTVQYTNLQYSAVQWNKYVFIQFLPYPPPSLPDTLRHPAIHLLPPHNNSVALRNVVPSVRLLQYCRSVTFWRKVTGTSYGSLKSPVVTIFTNIHQLYVLPSQCIYVFCVDLRTNSGYFPIQH